MGFLLNTENGSLQSEGEHQSITLEITTEDCDKYGCEMPAEAEQDCSNLGFN